VGFELTTLVVIGTDCIGKSNYHTIMTMTVPNNNRYTKIHQNAACEWIVIHFAIQGKMTESSS
jgi:hypothetical protein